MTVLLPDGDELHKVIISVNFLKGKYSTYQSKIYILIKNLKVIFKKIDNLTLDI